MAERTSAAPVLEDREVEVAVVEADAAVADESAVVMAALLLLAVDWEAAEADVFAARALVP